MGLTVKNIEKKKLRLKSFLIYHLGEEKGNVRYRALMKSSGVKTLIFKWGKEEGIEKYKKRLEKDRYKNTLPAFIERYGDQQGPIKYLEKNSRLSVGISTLEKKGRTPEEIQKIRDVHRSKSAQTLENFIIRYGKEEGTSKYVEFNTKRRVSSRSVKSLVEKKGLTIEQAKAIVKGVQVRDEQFFINKYGKEIGEAKFEEINRKRAYANTKAYYIEKYGDVGAEIFNKVLKSRLKPLSKKYYEEKYGEELGSQIYLNNKLKSNKFVKGGDSKIQLEFSEKLYNALPTHVQQFFEGMPIRESKIIFINKVDIKVSIPDITIKNVLVEFDGDYWHSLPDVIERDLLKVQALTQMGYTMLRVRESAYRKDKNGTVQDILNKILNTLKNEN